jgi:predicted outer membrane repeat protein
MNKLLQIFIVIYICSLTVAYSYAKNYYVRSNGNPALPGTSWGWASNNLQTIINKASKGDVIFVAAGKYYGGFIMKEGVNVLGGYTANVNNPTERYEMNDPDTTHYSILDGEGNQRVLTQLTPFSTSTVWDGFILRNGNPSTDFKTGSIIYSQTGDNQIVGILYQYNQETRTGKMIGTIEQYKQWGGYEQFIDELPLMDDRVSASSNTSGKENTATIIHMLAHKSIDFSSVDYIENGNYAAYWCDTLTTGGYTEWYLPAPGELHEVFNANIQTVLKNTEKNLTHPFWTSGQIGNTLAWAYCFGNGYFHPALKYTSYIVSAIHTFIEPEIPNGFYFAGGGAFIYENGVLNNCIVSNNTSASKGGGIYCWGGQILNCRVEGNNAPEGKEIYYETHSNTNETFTHTLKIYPNPAKVGQKLHIDWTTNSKGFKYKIIDITGKTIDSGNVNSDNTISAPLKEGIYLIILQSDKSKVTKNIIIK